MVENHETLAVSGNHYTLNLGQVLDNVSLPPLQFALANAANSTANGVSSAISAYSGTGFQVSGSQPPGTIAAGNDYDDLYLQPVTTNLGDQSESLTLTSHDVNDTGYSASLPDITLTVTDTVIAPAKGIVKTQTITFPGVRVGTPESQTISVLNAALTGATNLDVALTPGTGAVGSGSIALLAPGTTDDTDLSVGLATDQGGLRTGTVAVNSFPISATA